jgi:hydrogenase maturation protease
MVVSREIRRDPVRKTIVLCIGNLLLKDEGVGVHVCRALAERPLPPEVDLVDGGTVGCDLLPLLTEADKIIIVDALVGGEQPGDVYRLTLEQCQMHTDEDAISLHDLGIYSVLHDLKLLEGHLPEVVIIGIEPLEIGFGTELTREVAASLPKVLDLVIAELPPNC